MEPLTKKQFAFKLQLWLNHKRVLAKNSEYYRRADVAKSMGKVYDLYRMVCKDCSLFTMEQICYMVRLNRENLKTILPIVTNKSHAGELEKLTTILTIAESYKK